MNTSPYTFLGNRPFDIAPEATFDRGLVAVTVRSLGFGMAWTLARTAFVSPKAVRDSRSVDFRTDLEQFEVIGHAPFATWARSTGSASATSPTRSRSSCPTPLPPRQVRPAQRNATSGRFVQMPSTPSATSSTMRAGSSTVHTFTSRPAAWQASTRAASTRGRTGGGPGGPRRRGSPRRRCCRARPSSATRVATSGSTSAHPADAADVERREGCGRRGHASRRHASDIRGDRASGVEVGITSRLFTSTFTPSSHASIVGEARDVGRQVPRRHVADRAPVGRGRSWWIRELTVGGAAHVGVRPCRPISWAPLNAATVSRGTRGRPRGVSRRSSSGHHRAHLSTWR